MGQADGGDATTAALATTAAFAATLVAASELPIQGAAQARCEWSRRPSMPRVVAGDVQAVVDGEFARVGRERPHGER